MDFYLSQILKQPVFSKNQEKIGVIEDVVVEDITKAQPIIKGIILKRSAHKNSSYIPMHDIEAITPARIKLSTDVVDLAEFKQRNNEVLLANDVYDKQVVDIDDRRLTRVNDLLLLNEQQVIRLKGVDVSIVGILSRLHIPNLGNIFSRNVVDWEDVQFLGGQTPMKFNVQYKKLEGLHPVDIGRIIFEGPGYKHGSRVLSALKDPVAADIIEELSPKLQKNLIESMKIQDVADVVAQMSAHKAADLLVTLGREFSEKITPLLDKKHAQQINSLMSYPDYSAGAFMNLDYIALPATYTVEQVFKHLKALENLPDFLNYFYVLENEFSNKLIGVMSLYELYRAPHHNHVEESMNKQLIVANPNDHVKEALKKMYRYNLSALPVVRLPEHKLLGIVTFRDAVSIYLPRKWKLRFRQVFTNSN